MSLRDRLESKQRRRTVVPIPVSDAGDDLRQRAKQAEERAGLIDLAAKTGGVVDPNIVSAMRTEADELSAQVAEHYADVTLEALSPAAWEKLLDEFRTDADDLEEAALPHLLAACAVDPDLQDPAWWSDQFERPEWTFGEREALRSAVLRVNSYAPRPGLGKG